MYDSQWIMIVSEKSNPVINVKRYAATSYPPTIVELYGNLR